MSRFLSAAESRRRFPTLAAVRSDGVTLKGTVRASLCALRAALLLQWLTNAGPCAAAAEQALLYSTDVTSASLIGRQETRQPRVQLQIEYYDGQFDDARYALALAQTAALHGAHALNHVTCTRLLRDPASGRRHRRRGSR